MIITPELLAAFADGELSAADAAYVAGAVAGDPALSAQVEAHRALRVRLAAHFAPILDEPLPERLIPPVPVDQTAVIDFAAASAARRQANAPSNMPRRPSRLFGWPVMGAMAAALVLAVTIGLWPTGGGLTQQQIAALDTAPSGQIDDASVDILLSFIDDKRRLCRAYSQGADAGIACREDGSWQRVWRGNQRPITSGEMRQAGSTEGGIFEVAQDMAVISLNDEEERAAIARGWQP